MVHPVVSNDSFDVSACYLCNRSGFHDNIEKTIAKFVIMIGNASNNKVKAKAICENQTVFIAVFTRHGSLMMSAVAKIDQQNIFFENMQLSTKLVLFLEFVLLASDYSQFEYSLMSLLAPS